MQPAWCASFVILVTCGATAGEQAYTDEELDQWTPPNWLVENYRFYISGFDDDHRPIWIGEWGEFDLRKVAEGPEENRELFQKYLKKSERIVDQYNNASENVMKQMNVILDFDGFTFDQFTSLPTIAYVLGLAREYRSYIEDGKIARVIIINANYVVELLLQLGRGVFGRIFEVIDVYGSNPSTWKPALLRLFPKDQLPTRYGGDSDKPVFEYKVKDNSI